MNLINQTILSYKTSPQISVQTDKVTHSQVKKADAGHAMQIRRALQWRSHAIDSLHACTQQYTRLRASGTPQRDLSSRRGSLKTAISRRAPASAGMVAPWIEFFARAALRNSLHSHAGAAGGSTVYSQSHHSGDRAQSTSDSSEAMRQHSR